MTVIGNRGSVNTESPPWPTAQVAVRVWLFGALSTLSSERPLVLNFTPGFTVRDVINELGNRCGPAFLNQVLCAEGSLLRCCRLFADGSPVDELDAPLGADGSAIEVEIILLMGYEGG